MILIITTAAMRTLLIFCYILSFIFCFSCGEGTDKQKQNKMPELVGTKDTQKSDTKTILFFGTSLTAGMGLETDEAFPSIIQNKLDSLNLPYKTINAGLSGETTASGKNRINWVLNQKAAVFVLELGANDGLRGIPLEETQNNLQAIIDIVKQKSPDTKIVIAGMQIPPNMGQEYTSKFKNIFPQLAEKNKCALIPFLLKDVGGIPSLNQQDGIHPTAEGQKIIAENVWEVLKEVL